MRYIAGCRVDDTNHQFLREVLVDHMPEVLLVVVVHHSLEVLVMAVDHRLVREEADPEPSTTLKQTM